MEKIRNAKEREAKARELHYKNREREKRIERRDKIRREQEAEDEVNSYQDKIGRRALGTVLDFLTIYFNAIPASTKKDSPTSIFTSRSSLAGKCQIDKNRPSTPKRPYCQTEKKSLF